MIDHLEAVERGEIERLMVCMPPGSAKSTYTSVEFPAWFLGRNPAMSVIAASHTQELAERFGRSAPRWITHYMVGGYDPATDQVRIESFKPDAPTDAPWWLAWTHFLFYGSRQPGDWPKTQPE